MTPTCVTSTAPPTTALPKARPAIAAFLLLSAIAAPGASRVVHEWSFDDGTDPDTWKPANHITGLSVRDGTLQGTLANWDPWVRSPRFELRATPRQTVCIRLKTDCGGQGELFWTSTTQSPYGGFFPDKRTPFDIIGDGQWHEYEIMPFWQAEKTIIMMRVDFARPSESEYGRKSFALDYVRIKEDTPPVLPADSVGWETPETGAPLWRAFGGATAEPATQGLRVTHGPGPTHVAAGLRSPPLMLDTETAGCWITIELAATAGRTATFRWAADHTRGFTARTFDIIADGAFHTYNLNLCANEAWVGHVLMMELQPTDAVEGHVTVRRVSVGTEPGGPAELGIRHAGPALAPARAGRDIPFAIELYNNGGQRAANARIARLDLPTGVTVVSPADWRRLPPVNPGLTARTQLVLHASAPVSGRYRLGLTVPGGPAATCEGPLDFTPAVDLPRASYVPPPVPVKTAYELGAFYFPGWDGTQRWLQILRSAPTRKPVLGWYDEGNPECVDWQIKWAVENGLRFFLVDWYWSAGNRHHEHWIKAFQKARYRAFLRWAVMWANHNARDTHSEADQRAVTQYWIEHYFGTPEYYRIDDKPVVVIWSPENMERDMQGKGGAKRLLDISREMARAAGYKDIWFVCMKWPEASTDPLTIRRLADMGFDMTSLYHFMSDGGKAANPRHFTFDLVADASYPFWTARRAADVLPFLPNLSTGWDSRPWHGDKAQVISGRTVPLFRRICEDAKRFSDESGIRRLMIAPLNEWGEGSYAEPCAEFGFGMYETIRDVFCARPAGGWPTNIAPCDVGLGPYDIALPDPDAPSRTEWDFANGAQGWSAMMGLTDFAATDATITARTTGRDPAFNVSLNHVRASRFDAIAIRMKVEPAGANAGRLQVFWATTTAPTSEAASEQTALVNDGRFHDYVLNVAKNRAWRDILSELRLDPGSLAGVTVTLDRIRLIPKDANHGAHP